MKNILFSLTLLAGIFGSAFTLIPAASAVTAFEACEGAAAKTNTCKDVAAQEADGSNPIINNLKIVLDILSFIAGAAAVIILIVNGLRLILSNGDAQGVSSARSGLIYVVVGIVVVVLAQTIVIFLLDNI